MALSCFCDEIAKAKDNDMYDEPNGLDTKSLQIQLENYKLIVEVNADWIDENLLSQRETC